MRRPDGNEAGAHLVTAAPRPPSLWPLGVTPSTCASARRRPCAAPRSSCAWACGTRWPPSSCRARRPAGRALDSLDRALYGNELAVQRARLVAQRVRDSALRHRDLLLRDRPAALGGGRRHARSLMTVTHSCRRWNDVSSPRPPRQLPPNRPFLHPGHLVPVQPALPRHRREARHLQPVDHHRLEPRRASPHGTRTCWTPRSRTAHPRHFRPYQRSELHRVPIAPPP